MALGRALEGCSRGGQLCQGEREEREGAPRRSV